MRCADLIERQASEIAKKIRTAVIVLRRLPPWNGDGRRRPPKKLRVERSAWRSELDDGSGGDRRGPGWAGGSPRALRVGRRGGDRRAGLRSRARRGRSAHHGPAARQRRTAEKPGRLASLAPSRARPRGRAHRRRSRRPAARAGGPVQGPKSWACRASAPTSPTRPSMPRFSRAARTGGGLRWLPTSAVVKVEPGRTPRRHRALPKAARSGAARRRRRRPQLPSPARRPELPRGHGAYGQTAIAATFRHSRPHGGITTELHRRAGPLTTVPLPGDASSLVWVEEPPLRPASPPWTTPAFLAELAARLQGLLGSLSDVGPRAVYPLSGLGADAHGRKTASLWSGNPHTSSRRSARKASISACAMRAALAECVGDCAAARGEDIGSPADARGLSRERAPRDVLARTISVDLLNRSLLTDFLPAQALRGVGLHLLANVAPLRRLVMRGGMDAPGRLPRLMQPGALAAEPLTRRARNGPSPAQAASRRGAMPQHARVAECRASRICAIAPNTWRLRLIAATGAHRPARCRRQRLGQGLAADRTLRSPPSARAGQPGHRLSARRRCRSAQAIALAMWENLGRVMAETMQIDRILADPARIEIVSQNIHGRYKDKLGAAIGVSLHMGNWELADLAVHARRQQSRRRLPHRQEPLRRPLPARGCAKSSIPAACSARGATRRGGPDDGAPHHGLRAPRRPPGPRVRSARPHRTARALLRQAGTIGDHSGHDRPARSAHASGCRAACAWASRAASRSSSRSSRCRARPTQADDVKWITAEMQKQFEAWIREAPEQWMWSNRRWG